MQKERICSKCKKKKATTFIKQIVNGYPLEMYLCDDCAKDLDLEKEYNVFFSSIFGDLFEEDYTPQIPKKVVCKCGASEEDILNTGKFGCSECYKTFSSLVEKYIDRLGGSTYSGDMPKHIGENKSLKSLTIEGQIQDLTIKMKAAASNQDYELAKQYKNKIIELQSKFDK